MGCFIKVSLDDVMTPKAGFICITDHWWVVDGDNVLGFKLYGEKSKERPSPQCNSQKSIVDMLLKKESYKNMQAVYLPVAYWWPHRD
jgi:hypothetical protein